MPPSKRDKKGGLTLEKLASYDDVITDALVDKVNSALHERENTVAVCPNDCINQCQ